MAREIFYLDRDFNEVPKGKAELILIREMKDGKLEETWGMIEKPKSKGDLPSVPGQLPKGEQGSD